MHGYRARVPTSKTEARPDNRITDGPTKGEVEEGTASRKIVYSLVSRGTAETPES